MYLYSGKTSIHLIVITRLFRFVVAKEMVIGFNSVISNDRKFSMSTALIYAKNFQIKYRWTNMSCTQVNKLKSLVTDDSSKKVSCYEINDQ